MAGYCFLRSPVPVWTIKAINTHIADFTSDAQALWIYRRDSNKEKPEITLQKIDFVTGNVLTEHQAIFGLANHWCQVILSDDKQFAYLHVSQDRRQVKQNAKDLVIDLTTGATQLLDDPGFAHSRLSPTGKWIIREENHAMELIDRLSQQKVLSFKYESQSEFSPRNVCFHSDGSCLAVVWQPIIFPNSVTYGEIRFYETVTWKELSRATIPHKGKCRLDSWRGDQLWYWIDRLSGSNINDTTTHYDYYVVSAPLPLTQLSNAQLIFPGFHRSNSKPTYGQESRQLVYHGDDWHAIHQYRLKYQSDWLESLRQQPAFSFIINRFWPLDETALEFYRTSSQQLLNRMRINSRADYDLSPDGKWLVNASLDDSILSLYSTAPLIRWPGYLLVLAAILVLFNINLVGIFISLCHTPLFTRSGVWFRGTKRHSPSE